MVDKYLHSPCDGKCQINPTTNFCISCFRTIKEIINWITYTDEEKKNILLQIEKRKKSLTNKGLKK